MLFRSAQHRCFDAMSGLADGLEKLIAALKDERERLDWWEANLNCTHCIDCRSGEVVIDRVTGTINDREWHEVARAQTLRAALDLARRPA